MKIWMWSLGAGSTADNEIHCTLLHTCNKSSSSPFFSFFSGIITRINHSHKHSKHTVSVLHRQETSRCHVPSWQTLVSNVPGTFVGFALRDGGVNDASFIFIHVSDPSAEVNEQPVQKLVSSTNPIVLRGGGFLALAVTF